MKNKKLLAAIAVLLAVAAIFIIRNNGKKTDSVTTRTVYPHYGTIKTFVSTTGVIAPQNRLEVKPPINGRIEKILVNEGARVTAGQTLAWMSSTDRAALIDAARAQGVEQLKYWEDVYKPIPLIAPITGTVIVRALEPGQTATTTTAILVISDYLIVKANVDETDIGRIKKGQLAEISLDAYPDVTAQGSVVLIKYESTVINNVTTYEVYILPDKVPAVFKSGMSANINIIDRIKTNILLLESDAIKRDSSQNYVIIEQDKKQIKKIVETGLNNDLETEIVSGLTEKDEVLIMQEKFVAAPADDTNPFMPKPRTKK